MKSSTNLLKYVFRLHMSDTTPCIASYDRQKYHTIKFKRYKVSNIGPLLTIISEYVF